MLKLHRRPKSPNWVMRGTIGKRSIEETTGTADKQLAEEILVKRQNELMTEKVWGKKAVKTFDQAALDYVEHGKGEKRFLLPLQKHFGDKLLRDIDQDALDRAAAKLYPKATNATRNRQLYAPMSAILRHAARKGWCETPLISRPKLPKGKVRWIKPDEAEALLGECAPHFRPLVTFMLLTGARAGEALWLTWANVDLDRRQVTFEKTKNGTARSVPLHPRIVAELTALKHREGEVFRTPSGKPYSKPSGKRIDDVSAGSRIGTAFAGACRRAGIVDFTPHCLRHTWATWHYQANHDLTALQALGGWKTVSMVLRYAHTNTEGHLPGIEALPWGKSGETPDTSKKAS